MSAWSWKAIWHDGRRDAGKDMTTKVKLFLNLKDEAVARPLGLRRLRRAPGAGQRFEIVVDGRAVRARIARFSTASGRVQASPVPEVYAEEL